MYVDLAGLARYKSDFDAWARRSLLPKDAAAARVRTAKAGAVSFVPVQETSLDVSVDFLFFETGPAEGTKAPDNPSTITSVSNVTVTRCGKNIVRNLQNTTYRGVAFTVNADGSITVNRTSSNNNHSFFYITPLGTLKTGLLYSLSGCPSGGSGSTYCQRFGNATSMDTGSGLTAEILASPEMGNGLIRIDYRYSPDNLVFWPQIELGSEITSFEKSEYEDYTIDLNGTYYGGTLDVALGVMTVTHGVLILDGTENWSTPTQIAEGIYRHGFTRQNGTLYSLGSDGGSSCTHFNYIYSANAPQISYYLGSYSAQRFMYVNMKTSFSTAEAQKAWLASEYSAGHPVTITGLLYEPFTVQLSPTEILSLTQSSDYDPRVNTVYSDAQAVQVGYLKHPSAASADLRSALVSLGGGV